ncbi:Presequence protease 2, chloroplastic/mitochondrial [Ananas comosus]|uniref:Presequence protease 2, chloroplastic/mitochondrial n=1 Tax=Ananas comosus TaxID=4615 RepID=A0A199V0R0_ANACO|nr:Presequence protease 2, chloroplastic/mitochondrial [Ananas comosus]
MEFLQDLEKKVDDDWGKISISLEEIRKSLLSRKGCTINMTSDEENLVAATKYLSKFVDSLPTAFPGNNSWETILSPGNEAIVIPTQVHLPLFNLNGIQLKYYKHLEGYQLRCKGYSSLLRYLRGITEEYREKRHGEVLSTTVKDFKEFGDALEAVKDKWVVVAVASPSDVASANEQRPGFFDVKKVREVS